MSEPIAITAFYAFVPLSNEQLLSLQETLKAYGAKNGMRGLTLLAKEGVNGTVCGKPDVIAGWKELLQKHLGPITFKDSNAKELVFPRFFVKVREEIVTIKDTDVHPEPNCNHLSPEQWERMLTEEDVVVLDVRNDYETAIGMFEEAVDPGLKSFHEFPTYIEKADIPKKKKVLMYCTGGIRCEKALLAMQKQGFEHVYQLSGGILAYLKAFPNRRFQGECFVFDHRVSVDQKLQPSSRYHLCPHCGDPSDRHHACALCKKQCVVCHRCEKNSAHKTCSKDCRHRFERSMKRSTIGACTSS